MRKFFIGNIEIGNEVPLVIPEIGMSHEGSVEAAKEMVRSAHTAGARLIKHQTHIAEDEMSQAAKEMRAGTTEKSVYDMVSRYSLSKEEEQELMRYAEDLGMIYLSSPASREAADRLEEFGVKAYKIGSGEMNNYPLIEYIAQFKKPMIVSTGMNDIKSVAKTVEILEKYGVSYALMHATHLYPTEAKQVRLGAMLEMMKEFPDVPIGLSDHTRNNHACMAAMALGASLVERHFTDNKNRSGIEMSYAMDEGGLRDMLLAAREIPLMLGGEKQPVKEEQTMSGYTFATVVTICPVKAGEVFTKQNLWVKRPGTGGIPAELYSFILGKKAKCDIGTDVQLTRDMIEG